MRMGEQLGFHLLESASRSALVAFSSMRFINEATSHRANPAEFPFGNTEHFSDAHLKPFSVGEPADSIHRFALFRFRQARAEPERLIRHWNRIPPTRVLTGAKIFKVDILLEHANRISEAEPEVMPFFARFARWAAGGVRRLSCSQSQSLFCWLRPTYWLVRYLATGH